MPLSLPDWCCFFMNWWMLDLPLSPMVNAALYTATLTAGYILLLMSGVWISRMLKNNLMEDVFNTANEELHAGDTAHGE